jgi:hypothetical protein
MMTRLDDATIGHLDASERELAELIGLVEAAGGRGGSVILEDIARPDVLAS